MESNVEQVSERRSGGYLPTVWDHEFINSITTSYTYESDGNRLEELKRAALCLFTSLNRPEEKSDMIDKMQRLDIAKHFEKEIKEFLTHLNPNAATDLFTVALHFRLLRQHGFFVNSDVFKKFMNDDGKFEENLSDDVAGLLSLYEASYLVVHGEDDVLEEANIFTTKHLKLAVEKLDKENDLAEQIKESLEVPLYWRLPRTEARNFIDIYQRKGNKNLVMLQLAKLDFNLLQSIYLQELKDLAKWWKGVNIKEKLPFARDRLVECYFWALGIIPQPKYYKCRRNLTKYGALATSLDDVFDIYGSMDELDKYISSVKRWDVEAIEELPEYMKVCYKAMYDHVNEMVQDASSDVVGIDILPYIKDQWVCYVQSLHTEAGWYYGGYMPTLDEYLKNACVSIGVAPGLTYAFLAVLQESDSLHHSQLQLFDHWTDSDIFYLPSLITRLLDDLATFKVELERGEMTNTTQCYMKQEGVSEQEARQNIKVLISESWRRLNEFVDHPSLPKGFFETALSMTRCCQRMYQYGDFFGIQSNANKDCLNSSFFNHV